MFPDDSLEANDELAENDLNYGGNTGEHNDSLEANDELAKNYRNYGGNEGEHNGSSEANDELAENYLNSGGDEGEHNDSLEVGGGTIFHENVENFISYFSVIISSIQICARNMVWSQKKPKRDTIVPVRKFLKCPKFDQIRHLPKFPEIIRLNYVI